MGLICSIKRTEKPHSASSMKIKGPSAYIPVGLWWNCSNETEFISLDGPPVVALRPLHTAEEHRSTMFHIHTL